MEDDGFILVSKKKASKRKTKTYISYHLELEEDFHLSLRKIQKAKQKLRKNKTINPFLLKIKKANVTDKAPDVRYSSIICYGLGKISSCYNAQYQIAFLLIMEEYLQIKKVLAYDPIFSANDKKLLNYFEIHILSENELAKRIVYEKTLFYMPHCPFSLYNNLIWANLKADRLENVFLIGNSFQNMIRDNITRKFNKEFKYISMVEPFSVEYDFPNVKCDGFNNTKFVGFSIPSDLVIDKGVWHNLPEPVYSDE